MEPTSVKAKRPPTAPKPKIDPLQLLKCLSILLNANGGIGGETEVPRVKGLMSKYSKKLVSKCIYLNILQATDLPLLDAFYDEGGWELVGTWLQDAVKANNWPLALQVLSLLETSPMTITRLKRYATPRLVMELSRECVNTEVQSIAKQIFLKWMEVVRQGDGSGTMAGVGLSGGGPSGNDIPDSEPNEMSLEENSSVAEQPANAAAPVVNSDSAHECGDGSSSGEGQDDSSNASTESDTTPARTTPIRITIRSGSQVLAKVSSQRVSQDSNDSDDNKPLSIIRKEVRKSRTTSDEEVPEATALPDVTPEKEGASDSDANTGAVEASSRVVSANTSSTVNSCVTSSTNLVSGKIGDVSTVEKSKISESDGTSTLTPPTNSVANSVVSSSGSVSNSAPSSPSETEGESAMEINSEVERASDIGAVDSDTQEKKSVINNDENSGEGKVDETDSGKEKAALKSDKESKASGKDKNKDKDKYKDSEKKDKREKEEEKEKKPKDDKKKEREKDSKSSKSSSSSKNHESSRSDKSSKSDKHRSSSSHSRSSNKDKDRERESSSKSKDRDRENKSKDKDRDKDKSKSSSRDKDRKSSSRDKSREDKHDKKREQENEDKATLEKVKPLSADGLAKIPRKTPPPSFLDALGSADVDSLESKKPSVKTYKSRGFRNTGLLDEPTKPPGKKNVIAAASDKKSTSGTGGQGVKRPSPLDELVASSSMSEKRLKTSVSSSPLNSDKPGGVKLISPKRPSLSDDGGFMAALTASGTESRKKITRKRKSSESETSSSSKQENNKEEEEEEKKEEEKSPSSSPVKATEDKGIMLSPTSVKPTFNFYQETLKDDTDEEKKESSDDTKDEEATENGDVEMKDVSNSSQGANGNDSDNMDIEESEDTEDSVQIGLGEPFGGGGGGEGLNGRAGEAGTTLRDEDIPIAPAAPAPAQEDYEKVEVTFSEPSPSVRGVLVYHRREDRKKKSVKWRTEDDLQEVFFFELDETERVNVNTIKFNDMMALDKQREREAMGKSRGLHGSMMGGSMSMMGGNNHMMGMGMHHGQSPLEYMRWSLLPIMIPPPKVTPGCKSQERVTQAARESSTMAAFYNPAMLPETPREPDPEMVSRTEPKEIPVNDVTGQDMVYDHRSKMWPEPLFMEPMNYGYGGMGGPSSGGNEGGSHWVVGGPPAGGFPGPGGPMYGAPGGFGGPGPGPGPGPIPMGGPPAMGGPGMGGPPGTFGGDMGGGMDVPGWGGPAPGPPGPGPGPGMDYPNQNMMMGGGGPGMMMGGGGRPGPRGMMPNMGMGGQGFRGRNGPGGGSWGPGPSNYVKPVCKHFMNGHCRHGQKCRFLHTRH